ncbi:MAG: PD40 domain-containing protein [Bacteroidia bacterium]|nr:PD40 domain-containing protein [Bacteroidia bacterium]
MKNLYFFLVLIFTFSINAQENPLINYPNLSPDGSKIAFNYQGDIWTASINGKNLKRLTIHEAYDTNPHWTVDGKTIAFQSNRYGNYDVFTIPSEGGMPSRITFHSTNDRVSDITSKGDILFETSRNFVQVEREPEVHKVSLKGGTPFRFLNTLGFDATLSPSGKLVAFTRGSCRIEREAYQGPANRDIWVYNIENDAFYQVTTFDCQDLDPQWADNTTLYFQSARSGKYNVHKVTLSANGEKSGSVEQISNLTKMGLTSFDLSNNGKDIIMISGDKLFHLDVNTKTSTPAAISIQSDYRFDPRERKTFSDKASQIAVSPNGKYRAIVVRGEVFITENDTKKSRTINVSNSPYRDLDSVWLSDEVLLFVSDREGEYNLFSVTSNDENNTNIFTSLKHKLEQLTKSKSGVSNPVLSPDKKSIAYNEGSGKLVVASISEKGKISNSKVLVDSWNSPSNVSWSPDSKWLCYDISDLYFNDEIYVHKADDSMKPVNISMHPKGDFGGIWSADGKKIGFSSNRNNGDYDVWYVWLRKKDWEKTKQDWDETTDDKDKKSKDKSKEKDEDKKEDKEVVDVVIDFENIHERQEQITSYAGGEFLSAISKDGKTFYYTTGNGSRGNIDVTSDLYSISWEGKDKKELTKGNSRPGNVTLTPKNDYI